MSTHYTIRNWDDLFENAQSRKCNQLRWVLVRNKHDGKSYRRLIQMPNGPALYAAWVLMLQVASKCPTRGVLADEDGPLDADDLAAKTGCPVELFAEAFEVLSSPRIGWLDSGEPDPGRAVGACSQSAPSTLPDHATVSSQKRREGKGIKTPSPPSPCAQGGGDGYSWGDFEADIQALGVATVSRTVKEARSRMEPSEARQIVQEFRDFPDGLAKAGALTWRVENGSWPFDVPELPGDPEQERLESEHGDELDGWDDLPALCEAAGLDYEGEESRTHPLFRVCLLRHLDERKGASP